MSTENVGQQGILQRVLVGQQGIYIKGTCGATRYIHQGYLWENKLYFKDKFLATRYISRLLIEQ